MVLVIRYDTVGEDKCDWYRCQFSGEPISSLSATGEPSRSCEFEQKVALRAHMLMLGVCNMTDGVNHVWKCWGFVRRLPQPSSRRIFVSSLNLSASSVLTHLSAAVRTFTLFGKQKKENIEGMKEAIVPARSSEYYAWKQNRYGERISKRQRRCVHRGDDRVLLDHT